MADEEPRAEEEPSEPARPKKKKKKKSAAAPGEAPVAKDAKSSNAKKKDEPDPLPGAGTPDGDKLRKAVRAFEVGDYALVRTLTDELGRCDEPAIRKSAAALRDRIGIDPIQIAVIAACALVLLTIVYVWVI
jgi:hypothetical protein